MAYTRAILGYLIEQVVKNPTLIEQVLKNPAMVSLWTQNIRRPLLLEAPVKASYDLSAQDEHTFQIIIKKLRKKLNTNGTPRLAEYVVTNTADIKHQKKDESEDFEETLERLINFIKKCTAIPIQQHLEAHFEEKKSSDTKDNKGSNGDELKTTVIKPSSVNSITRVVLPEFLGEKFTSSEEYALPNELLPRLITALVEFASTCPKNFHIVFSSFLVQIGSEVFNKMFYLTGGADENNIGSHTKLFTSTIDPTFSYTNNAQYAYYSSIKRHLKDNLNKLLKEIAQDDSIQWKKNCEQLRLFVLNMPSYPSFPIELLKAIHDLKHAPNEADTKEINELKDKVKKEKEIFFEEMDKAEELEKELIKFRELKNLLEPKSANDVSKIKNSCKDLITIMSKMIHPPNELLETIKILEATTYQFNSKDLRLILNKALSEANKFISLPFQSILSTFMPTALLSLNNAISLGANSKFQTAGGIEIANYKELCLDARTGVAKIRFDNAFFSQQRTLQMSDPEYSTQILSAATIEDQPESQISSHLVHADSERKHISLKSESEVKIASTYSLQLGFSEAEVVAYKPVVVDPTRYRMNEVDLYKELLLKFIALQSLRRNDPDLISRKIIKEILIYILRKMRLVARKHNGGLELESLFQKYQKLMDAALNRSFSAETLIHEAHLIAQEVESWVFIDSISNQGVQELLRTGEMLKDMIGKEDQIRAEYGIHELTTSEAKQSGHLLIRFIQEGKNSQAIHLLYKGVSATAKDEDGHTALWWAFRMRNVPLITELIKRLKPDTTEKIYIGPESTPKGANVDETGPIFLVVACTQIGFKDEDKKAIIKTIFENNQDLAQKTSDGRTLFDFAIADSKLLGIFLEVCPDKLYSLFEKYVDNFLTKLSTDFKENLDAKAFDSRKFLQDAQLIADCCDKNTPLGKLIEHVHNKRKDSKLLDSQVNISEILTRLKVVTADTIKTKYYDAQCAKCNTQKSKVLTIFFINNLLNGKTDSSIFIHILERLSGSNLFEFFTKKKSDLLEKMLNESKQLSELESNVLASELKANHIKQFELIKKESKEYKEYKISSQEGDFLEWYFNKWILSKLNSYQSTKYRLNFLDTLLKSDTNDSKLLHLLKPTALENVMTEKNKLIEAERLINEIIIKYTNNDTDSWKAIKKILQNNGISVEEKLIRMTEFVEFQACQLKDKNEFIAQFKISYNYHVLLAKLGNQKSKDLTSQSFDEFVSGPLSAMFPLSTPGQNI